MPLKIIHPNHYEIIGTGLVLLSSPPSLGKDPDFHTGVLTEEIALISKSHAIIGKERKLTDPSEIESALSQFTTRVRELVGDQGIKFILEIRGKKETGFKIRTGPAASVTDEILEIVKAAFAMSSPVAVAELGPTDHPAVSNNSEVQTIVLDLGPDERETQRESIIEVAAETVGLINSKLGLSGMDEGIRDVLD